MGLQQLHTKKKKSHKGNNIVYKVMSCKFRTWLIWCSKPISAFEGTYFHQHSIKLVVIWALPTRKRKKNYIQQLPKKQAGPRSPAKCNKTKINLKYISNPSSGVTHSLSCHGQPEHPSLFPRLWTRRSLCWPSTSRYRSHWPGFVSCWPAHWTASGH